MERAAEKLQRLAALSQKRSGRNAKRVSDTSKSSETSFKYALWSETLVGMKNELGSFIIVNMCDATKVCIF